MRIIIKPNGTIRHIYDERIDLSRIGIAKIQRASHVEPEGLLWKAYFPEIVIGPFQKRSEALRAEISYIENHLL